MANSKRFCGSNLTWNIHNKVERGWLGKSYMGPVNYEDLFSKVNLIQNHPNIIVIP